MSKLAGGEPPVSFLARGVIDCRSGTDGLERTLESLAAAGSGLEPILIGAPPAFKGSNIAAPKDLSSLDKARVWLCPLRPGDELARDALAIYAMAAQGAPHCGLIYADDDLLGPGGRHYPHFKPDWNAELFEHHDFLTCSSVLQASPEQLARLPDHGWAQALVREAIGSDAAPLHLHYVLHHRRSRPNPIIPGKPSGIRSLIAPAVTAIVPTRNQEPLLRKCLDGLKQTAYDNLDVIVVDNGSDDDTRAYLDELKGEGITVLHMPGKFNYSALNNSAVGHARGELLCFLNNDVEVTDPDWLTLLAVKAARPEYGAVGARLLYPDGTVQHAGVVVGVGGGAGHAHRFEEPDEPGYFSRSRLPQRVTAVTAATLVVSKDKFLAVGGFDESDFPIAFNDVDLCLKLNERGWQSFYEPRSTLIHYESKSRGSDRLRKNRARFAGELASLKRKWGTDRKTDPFHHPHLSRYCEQFLVSI